MGSESETLARLTALEAQVQELKSVQDLLLRLLSTTRPLANLLEYYGATEAAEQQTYKLLDETLAAVRGPESRRPTFYFFHIRLAEIFPALKNDRTFVQGFIDALQVDRPAHRELHAYMKANGWPRWD